MVGGINYLLRAPDRLSGKISRMKRQGPLVRVEVRCCEYSSENDFILVALVTQPSAVDMGLEIGKSVTLTLRLALYI